MTAVLRVGLPSALVWQPSPGQAQQLPHLTEALLEPVAWLRPGPSQKRRPHRYRLIPTAVGLPQAQAAELRE